MLQEGVGYEICTSENKKQHRVVESVHANEQDAENIYRSQYQTSISYTILRGEMERGGDSVMVMYVHGVVGALILTSDNADFDGGLVVALMFGVGGGGGFDGVAVFAVAVSSLVA
ncbi:Hypothetical predicted protein [Octopus vulgaris]|uniref:Uncharacterized protein n=1 Tax=Octopus vulgaris TaxID=6645 RepID=A0AA36FBZ5_OCTVU|nr:Hypothetical predicted protein [Octopus vulgaris]